MQIVAGVELVVGWSLWAILLQKLDKAAAWAVWDFYACTLLLGIATLCLALAILLDAASPLWGVGVVLLFVVLGRLGVRSLRRTGRTARLERDAPRPDQDAPTWTERTADDAAPLLEPFALGDRGPRYSSRRVQDIMKMEVEL